MSSQFNNAFSRKKIDKKNKTLVALATYNEIENILPLINDLLAINDDLDILVVDDNSPDGTGVCVKKFSMENNRVDVIIRENERGLGTAVIRALSYAVENDYEYVVNMDADFSHPVEVVPQLIARMNDDTEGTRVDVTIGSRYVKGGGVKNWPMKRRLMSRGINAFARAALGLKTRDNSGSFRCYRVSKLRTLDFDKFISRGYSFFEEALFRLKNNGARFAEIPIVFVDRRYGSSKINRAEAIKAALIITKLGFSRLFHFHI